MILPIYGYGNAVLRKETDKVDLDMPGLEEFVENMWETMYNAKGVGLAAPQVGHSKRLFIVDTVQVMEEGQEEKGIKKVFINAEIEEEYGDDWWYEEGCLSIPHIRGDVERAEGIVIRYQDLEGNEYTEEYDGINARVILHEYDHVDGILFTELLKPLKRQLIKRKLEQIRKGKVKADYRLKFADV